MIEYKGRMYDSIAEHRLWIVRLKCGYGVVSEVRCLDIDSAIEVVEMYSDLKDDTLRISMISQGIATLE